MAKVAAARCCTTQSQVRILPQPRFFSLRIFLVTSWLVDSIENKPILCSVMDFTSAVSGDVQR